MSRPPIVRNPDLLRLIDEGYALRVDPEGVLVVEHIPYVTAARVVKYGTIAVPVNTAGTIEDIVGFPDHTVYLTGEMPSDEFGQPLTAIVIGSPNRMLSSTVTGNHHCSRKPAGGYRSMYDQIRAYITLFERFARAVDPDATAKVGPRVTPAGESAPSVEEQPFVYADTASVRSGIVKVNAKVHGQRIAIVGLGGTGSYVLDQVSKTPVAQIGLFDDDVFYTHNAFRGPGAARVKDLQAMMPKVHYWRDRYAEMHRGITTHPYRVTLGNVDELQSFSFVFLCMDSGPDKRAIVEALEGFDIPFIDCGIGVQEVNGALRGTVRATTSTSRKRDHVARRVPFAPPRQEGDYERNIQVADLNALNALLAVMKWKKLSGVYHDFSEEYDTTYTINSHLLTRDEQAEAS